jgi:type I restriction enzyme S subunit
MGNIVDGSLVLENFKYLPSAHAEFPRLFLEPGDLLFNRTNSAELVGKSAVYLGAPTPCSFASYLIRVRFADRMLPQFANYCLNSAYGRDWIRSVVSQQVGQANVSGGKLKAFVVPVPSLPHQAAIVEEAENQLSAILTQMQFITRSLLRAERTRQSILAQAFSGRLTAHCA